MKSCRHTIWSNIINYNGYYVSLDGDICSAKSKYDGSTIAKWKRLQLRLDNNYVSRVSLSSKGKVIRFSPQQLVGMHFPIKVIGKGVHINHKNGIHNDNRVENLEWCDQQHNEKHSWKVLGKTHSPRDNINRSKTLCSTKSIDRINVKYTKEIVLEIIRLGKEENMCMHKIASKVGVSHSAPSRILMAKEIGIYKYGTRSIEHVVIQ